MLLQETNMNTKPMALEPTTASEWATKDSEPTKDEARKILTQITVELPTTLMHTHLLGYSAQHATPLDAAILPDLANYDYHLIEVPVTIIVPYPHQLIRLCLSLDLVAPDQSDTSVVAYDLFPRSDSQFKDVDIGSVSLDVSKALTFIFPAPIAAPIADALGLRLSLPIKWTSRTFTIQASEPASNHVEWIVEDEAINNGFTGYVIIEGPRAAAVCVQASLVCEVRSPRFEVLQPSGGLPILGVVRYRTSKPATYLLRQ